MSESRVLRKGRPPRKGSKRREFLLLAMRPQGVSRQAVVALFGNANRLSAVLSALINEKGFDIRSFRNGHVSDAGRGGHPLKSYRLVGKMLPSGGYRSFVDPTVDDTDKLG